jgi:hypothetical protein
MEHQSGGKHVPLFATPARDHVLRMSPTGSLFPLIFRGLFYKCSRSRETLLLALAPSYPSHAEIEPANGPQTDF